MTKLAIVTDICTQVSVIKSQYFDYINTFVAGIVMSNIKSLVIVTDAWFPQVNGVVRTLSTTKAELEKKGCQVAVISPDGYLSVPCPTYTEIRLALFASKAVGKRLSSLRPDAIHIANSNYVFLGDSFKADVFLAAEDTTQSPTIFVGDYELGEDGQYRMVGDYYSVHVVSG